MGRISWVLSPSLLSKGPSRTPPSILPPCTRERLLALDHFPMACTLWGLGFPFVQRWELDQTASKFLLGLGI